MRGVIAVLAAGVVTAACAAPLGLGEPSTRALERGVEQSLDASPSFEVTGRYAEAGTGWKIDLQFQRPDAEHLMLSGGGQQLEVIVAGGQAYFRGAGFLASHLGGDALARQLASAAGNAWWRGSPGLAPRMPDLLDGAAFRTAFLGSAAARRTDHVILGSLDTVELSGQRADVYVAEAPPYRLVRLVLKPGVVIDGVADADLGYGAYERAFAISAPSDVIDFSNLSTLPPLYSVLSVDTSTCTSPCVVTAQLKNLGGTAPARGPSSVTFVMSDAASGRQVATCVAVVAPDVGYNATAAVSCTLAASSEVENAAIVTATPENPGHA